MLFRSHLVNGDFSQTFKSDQEICLPVDWELTMGEISCDVEVTSDVILGNLESEQVTGLSQIVPVSAGCDYQLEIFAYAKLEDAVVEIIWLGSECSVAQVDRMSIPLQTVTGTSTPITPATTASALSQNIALLGMKPTRARYKAPDEVTQAEVRIKVPEGNKAIVESISLLATQEMLSNTDLNEIDILHWEIRGGTAVEILSQDQGLVNKSTEEISLIQSVSVLENKPFSFAFKRTPNVPVISSLNCLAYRRPSISSIMTKSAFSSFAKIKTSASPSSKSTKKLRESEFFTRSIFIQLTCLTF